MSNPRDCVMTTGDPDLNECNCLDCVQDRQARDDIDAEMNGEPEDG